VEKSLKELEGVTEVRVELSEGAAYIKGEIDPMKVKETINSLGYEFVE
jgi:copper chaperone CopZ